MKKYKCHKEVMAAKITNVYRAYREPRTNGVWYEDENAVDRDDSKLSVSNEWLEKHQPEEGGYLVEYEDGYISYSPAEAFEAGYTELGQQPSFKRADLTDRGLHLHQPPNIDNPEGSTNPLTGIEVYDHVARLTFLMDGGHSAFSFPYTLIEGL